MSRLKQVSRSVVRFKLACAAGAAIPIVASLITARASAQPTHLSAFSVPPGAPTSQIWGPAVSPDGTLYVADSGKARIHRFAADGTFLSSFGAGGSGNGQFNGNFDVSIGPANNVYVADTLNDRIQIFSPTGTFLSAFGGLGTNAGQFNKPHSTAFGPDGLLVVTDRLNRRIQKFTPTGTFASQFPVALPADPVDWANGIATDRAGNIYFADSLKGRALKYSPAGVLLSVFNVPAGGSPFSVGVAVGGSGRVYLTHGDSRVIVFAPDTTFLYAITPPTLPAQVAPSPSGIDVASSGFIYITDFTNNNVRRYFDPDEWVSGANTFTTAGVGPAQLLGQSLQLSAGKSLSTQNLTIHSGGSLTLNGGSLNTQDLTLTGIGANFAHLAGTLEIDGRLAVADGAFLALPAVQYVAANNVEISTGGSVEFSGGSLASSTLTNQGYISGPGRLEARLVNAAAPAPAGAGEIALATAQTLTVTGNQNLNAGLVNLTGGTLRFTQDFTNEGLITGHGTLRADGGSINTGTIALSGVANVLGDLHNKGGTLIVSGAGVVTFFDDVKNDGVIRVQRNSAATFFGEYSGDGTEGEGHVFLEGDLKPGSSPADVSFGGDLTLGPAASLNVELGGNTPGQRHDRVNVAGHLTPRGTLRVTLIDGFVPTGGDRFDVVTFASTGGTFDAYQSPDLPGDLVLAPLYTDNLIQLAATLPGDADTDFRVTFADFQRLELSFGKPGTWAQGDFDHNGAVNYLDFLLLYNHFGQSALAPDVPINPADAAALQAFAAANVPEPGAGAALLCAVTSLTRHRRRRAFNQKS
jgi:sugar lactone lactonase YvrE